MRIEINITPTSLKMGVLGLPIKCCRDWDARESVEGLLVYAGRETDITFTPKHVNHQTHTAPAWQFTVNDSVQYNQLKMDGVHTYIEERVAGEKLICDLDYENSVYTLRVVDVLKKPETKASEKVKSFLQQGLREKVHTTSSAPLWNSPSEWIDYTEIDNYSEIQDCLYIWSGIKENAKTIYLYVGIVGDTKFAGKSKRNLAQRLNEEKKKFYKEDKVEIKKFRFCSINNARGYSVPELLKTIEMSEITIMTSLFRCENARDNINALLADYDVVLLNKMTSYKYVE